MNSTNNSTHIQQNDGISDNLNCKKWTQVLQRLTLCFSNSNCHELLVRYEHCVMDTTKLITSSSNTNSVNVWLFDWLLLIIQRQILYAYARPEQLRQNNKPIEKCGRNGTSGGNDFWVKLEKYRDVGMNGNVIFCSVCNTPIGFRICKRGI